MWWSLTSQVHVLYHPQGLHFMSCGAGAPGLAFAWVTWGCTMSPGLTGWCPVIHPFLLWKDPSCSAFSLSPCSDAAQQHRGWARRQEKEEFAFQICHQPAGWKPAKVLLVMPVLESWTGQENSMNRGQRKTVVIADSFRGKFIFVHNVFTIWVFKGLVTVGIMPCWKQALCTWMNCTYLRRNFSFWKNTFIQSFDSKISIHSRIIDCFTDKLKKWEGKKKKGRKLRKIEGWEAIKGNES